MLRARVGRGLAAVGAVLVSFGLYLGIAKDSPLSAVLVAAGGGCAFIAIRLTRQ